MWCISIIKSIPYDTNMYVQQKKSNSAGHKDKHRHDIIIQTSTCTFANLGKIYVESRDWAQAATHHSCLGGNDPEGGEAAEVRMAFIQEPTLKCKCSVKQHTSVGIGCWQIKITAQMAAQTFQRPPPMQVKVKVMIEAVIIFCPISCNLPFYNYWGNYSQ